MKVEEKRFPKRAYELLSWVAKGRDITVRDDQYDFPWLMDIVRYCRRRRCRFRLIDTGKMENFQLEWLGEIGADFYTSDEARPKAEELELVNKACRRGGAVVAYFHHGPLEVEERKEADLERISFSVLERMVESGIYIHISNRERERNLSRISELAYACQSGGGWLVYYHHGPLEPSLEELGREGAWIHLDEKSINDSEDISFLIETVKASLKKGANVVLHLEGIQKINQLSEIVKAGAIILFHSLLRDYKSPLTPLEKEAGKRKLDFRAYYLYPNFLP